MLKNEVKILDSVANSSYPVTSRFSDWEGVVQSDQVFHIVNRNILVEFDISLRSRIYAKFNDEVLSVGDFSNSHYIVSYGKEIFDFEPKRIQCWNVNDDRGKGNRYEITGTHDGIEKKLSVSVYDMFPSTVFFTASYKNTRIEEISIDRWVNNNYSFFSDSCCNTDIVFWSYQSGSYECRPDWVLPLRAGFSQENYMGMNASDYGGGTPVSDVWRKDVGIAVGHTECGPKLVSLPVCVTDKNQAFLGIDFKRQVILRPGESLTTFETFVTVHQGDYFNALSEYRRIMMNKGIKFEPITQEAYEPTWCAWGYERNFRLEQVYGALPMVKKLGLHWVCLDDGWQTEEGDYSLVKEKFPNGDADMKRFVDTVHSEGLKAQLWWIPLAFDPKSELYREHPEYALVDESNEPQRISWWDNYYMCPACNEVIEHTREALKKILIDWGFDSLKIDGQHLNAVPLCYNQSHHHEYAEQSYEAVPGFFKMIYDMAREIKPDVTVMFCPCGTAYSFFTMPYYNIPVASDPESSWQVRTKGKAFKALMGANAAFHGDHVELSDHENDFASTVGIGGVIDTKFTWPVGSAPVSMLKPDSTYDLDASKEEVWDQWLRIYREKMLPQGTYMGGLYTIGYDFPEGHAVKKEDSMYYAFFSEKWEGEIELRGLEDKEYSVYDYINGIHIAKVNGLNAKMKVNFDRYLLLEVRVL